MDGFKPFSEDAVHQLIETLDPLPPIKSYLPAADVANAKVCIAGGTYMCHRRPTSLHWPGTTMTQLCTIHHSGQEDYYRRLFKHYEEPRDASSAFL